MVIIAVDCDDTLSLTNSTICHWHNNHFGTDLTLDDYKFFHYWRIPGWGDMSEAQLKVRKFNRSPEWDEIPVNREAIDATKKLKEAGHTLYIITARMASEADKTRDWIEKHFPDTFTEIFFTSAFESRSADAQGGPQDEEAAKKVPENQGRLPYTSMPKPKSEVCKYIGAHILVDDSLENAHEVHANAGIPVALYGDWQWNKVEIDPVAASSPKSYAQRVADGDKEPEEPAHLPPGISRTLQWSHAVDLIGSL